MKDLSQELRPDYKNDEIERELGHKKAIKIPVKTWAVDWDGWLERLWRKVVGK